MKRRAITTRCFQLLALLLVHAGASQSATLRLVPLHSRANVGLSGHREIFVEVVSGRITPYLRDSSRAKLFRTYPVRIEWAEMSPSVQSMALRRLFPADSVEPGFWVHRPTAASASTPSHGIEEIALWFTGTPQTAAAIMQVNPLGKERLTGAREIRIPRQLLLQGLVQLVPKKKATTLLQVSSNATNRAALRSSKPKLTYGQDARGRYGIYRLLPGEAIYSAVVVRFTGRIHADDVNEAAKIIQKRSGVRNERDIPSGFPILIPLDLLEPEFLPESDPRYQKFLAHRKEAAQYRSRTVARGLEGVVVVLDPGHGGRDPGTIGVCGICEDEYVYDITTRVARIIESETRGRALFTLIDTKHGLAPRNRKNLPKDSTERVLTTPRYDPRNTRVSANLRWYLANSMLRREAKRGTSREKMVFASFHADSRHRSTSGLMVYIAGAVHSRGAMSKNKKPYTAFAEVREQPRVSLPYKSRLQSEAVSRDLAELVVRSMKRWGIAVHKEKPIRRYVIRKRKRWVPAVIRYNQIPAKMLIEVGNMSNRADCRALGDPAHRERLARAFVDALIVYYGQTEDGKVFVAQR